MKTLIKIRNYTFLYFALTLFSISGCKKSVDPINNNTSTQWSTTGVISGIPVDSYIFFLTSIGSSLYVGTWNGLFVSNDKGSTFKSINSGLNSTFVRCVVNNGTKLFVGTNNGVYTSTNGVNWLASNTGIPTANSQVNVLLINGANIFAGTKDGIYLSTNNGINWSPASNGIPIYTGILSLQAIGNTIYASNDVFNLNKFSDNIYKSIDNGTSWSTIKLPLTLNNEISCFTTLGVNLFAGKSEPGLLDKGGVFKSINNGTTWTTINNGLFHNNTGQPYVPVVQELYSNGTELYAGTYEDGVFKSTDNGANWAQVAKGSPTIPIDISSLATIGTSVFVATSASTLDGGGIWVLK